MPAAAGLLPSTETMYPLSRVPIAACTSASAATPVTIAEIAPPTACGRLGSVTSEFSEKLVNSGLESKD